MQLRKLGTVTEKPGSVQRGSYDCLELPTGGWEKLPVVIVSGKEEGPTFLLTANIHGGEVIGTIAIHRFLSEVDPLKLKGRIIAMPSLNPSGLLVGTRTPQWEASDPNRKWPNFRPKKIENLSKNLSKEKKDWLEEIIEKDHVPGPQERAWKALFAEWKELNPSFCVDLHSTSPDTIPFTFLERVFYKEGEEKQAMDLAQRIEAMAKAFGISVLSDTSPNNYFRTDMYRTTSSSCLHGLQVPACTIELGTSNTANPFCLRAAVQGLKNLLSWAGMISDPIQEIRQVPVIQFKERMRVIGYPFSPVCGIVDALVDPGSFFKKGELLAVIRSLQGEKLAEVYSEFDGVVLGWRPGVTRFANQLLGWSALPDRLPLIAPWE